MPQPSINPTSDLTPAQDLHQASSQVPESESTRTKRREPRASSRPNQPWLSQSTRTGMAIVISFVILMTVLVVSKTRQASTDPLQQPSQELADHNPQRTAPSKAPVRGRQPVDAEDTQAPGGSTTLAQTGKNPARLPRTNQPIPVDPSGRLPRTGSSSERIRQATFLQVPGMDSTRQVDPESDQPIALALADGPSFGSGWNRQPTSPPDSTSTQKPTVPPRVPARRSQRSGTTRNRSISVVPTPSVTTRSPSPPSALVPPAPGGHVPSTSDSDQASISAQSPPSGSGHPTSRDTQYQGLVPTHGPRPGTAASSKPTRPLKPAEPTQRSNDKSSGAAFDPMANSSDPSDFEDDLALPVPSTPDRSTHQAPIDPANRKELTDPQSIPRPQAQAKQRQTHRSEQTDSPGSLPPGNPESKLADDHVNDLGSLKSSSAPDVNVTPDQRHRALASDHVRPGGPEGTPYGDEAGRVVEPSSSRTSESDRSMRETEPEDFAAQKKSPNSMTSIEAMIPAQPKQADKLTRTESPKAIEPGEIDRELLTHRPGALGRPRGLESSLDTRIPEFNGLFSNDRAESNRADLPQVKPTSAIEIQPAPQPDRSDRVEEAPSKPEIMIKFDPKKEVDDRVISYPRSSRPSSSVPPRRVISQPRGADFAQESPRVGRRQRFDLRLSTPLTQVTGSSRPSASQRGLDSRITPEPRLQSNPAIKSDAKSLWIRYVVDDEFISLRSLARDYLGDSKRSRELALLNQGRIDLSRHFLKPGTVVLLPADATVKLSAKP